MIREGQKFIERYCPICRRDTTWGYSGKKEKTFNSYFVAIYNCVNCGDDRHEVIEPSDDGHEVNSGNGNGNGVINFSYIFPKPLLCQIQYLFDCLLACTNIYFFKFHFSLIFY